MKWLLALILSAAPALAASGPDWPCQAARRPALSIGQMWTATTPDAASAAAAARPEVQALAARLASRKIPLDDLAPDLDAFAADADAATMTGLFQAAFDTLEQRRVLVVSQIDSFTTAQRRMTATIEGLRTRMADMEKADKPDFDAIDAAEEQLDLNTRMFKERQDQIRYVCEVPNLIEQRVFALSRAIAQRIR